MCSPSEAVRLQSTNEGTTRLPLLSLCLGLPDGGGDDEPKIRLRRQISSLIFTCHVDDRNIVSTCAVESVGKTGNKACWQGSRGTAYSFAARFPNVSARDCLIALLDHHEQHGGGLRWFVLRNDEVVARANPTATSSRYRFRLWPLCRIATQCGVIRSMPAALALDGPEDTGDDEET